MNAPFYMQPLFLLAGVIVVVLVVVAAHLLSKDP